MPFEIRSVGNGKWAIFRKDTGERAVKRTYNSRSSAARVARLRERHAGEKPSV